jgi:hypothetical protein
MMLDLDNPFWSQIQHAYGAASDIPPLLRQLTDYPSEGSYQDEPWYTLWSSLCHQGDIYPASFAAVPHIVQALAIDPTRATHSYFLLPACIEIARVTKGIAIPPAFEAAYFEALARLPSLAGSAAKPSWDESTCTSALAAVAAATGNHPVAQLLLETEPQDILAVIDWLHSR